MQEMTEIKDLKRTETETKVTSAALRSEMQNVLAFVATVIKTGLHG